MEELCYVRIERCDTPEHAVCTRVVVVHGYTNGEDHVAWSLVGRAIGPTYEKLPCFQHAGEKCVAQLHTHALDYDLNTEV